MSARPRSPALRALGLALALALTPAAGIGCAGRSTGATAPPSPAERPPPFAVAPDFQLPDSSGRTRSLAELTGERGLIVVIYRGHW